MVLAIVLQVWLAQAGCTKDTDCKGDRICEAGVCVSPKPPPPPQVDLAAPPPPPPASGPSRAPLAPAAQQPEFSAPPPPPQPATTPSRTPLAATPASEEWPRVVRRDGLVCVQAPGADGRIEESCRTEQAERVVMPHSRRGRGARASEQADEAREPAARFVLDVLGQGGGGLLVASGGALFLPQINAQLALGVRFRSGVGVVGLGSIMGMFGYGLTALFGTVAPGIRFGDRSHFTLAAGTSFGSFTSSLGTSGGGVMLSVLAQGVIATPSPFGFALQGGFHVDASGVMFTIGGGFGLGAY